MRYSVQLPTDRVEAFEDFCTAEAIADMLVEMVSHTEKKYRPDDARMATLKNDLEKKYYHWLRQRESEGLNALKLVYQHNRLKVEMPSLQAVEDDLLANDTMNRLGLSKTELVAASAMGGAAVGGTIDEHAHPTKGGYYLKGGKMYVFVPEKRLRPAYLDGHVTSVGPWQHLKVENVGETDVHAIFVELKQPAE